jgi:hypothetical protein
VSKAGAARARQNAQARAKLAEAPARAREGAVASKKRVVVRPGNVVEAAAVLAARGEARGALLGAVVAGGWQASLLAG